MDSAQFSKHVLGCEQKLFRIAYLTLGGYEGTEDAVQETFAVAKQSGLLDRIFAGQTPSPAAEAILESPNNGFEKDGLKITVDEYIYDGASLSMGWTVESEIDKPILLGSSMPNLNGQGFYGGSMTAVVGNDMPALLGGEVDGKSYGHMRQDSVELEIAPEMRNQPIEFTMTATAYTTTLPFIVGEADYDSADEPLDLGEGMAVTPVGYVRTYQYRETDSVDALVKAGLLTPVAEVDVKVSIQPPDAQKLNDIVYKGENRFEFDEYTLVVERLEFLAASSLTELRLYPKRALVDKDLPDGEWELDPLRQQHYRLLNEDDKNIFEGLTGGWEGGLEKDDQGTEYIRWLGTWGPIADVPNQITIMPYLDGDYGDDTQDQQIPDQAVTLMIKQ